MDVCKRSAFASSWRRWQKDWKLTGWVKNLWDGDVEMEVQGDPAAIGRLIQGLESGHFIRIEHMEVEEIPVIRECEFRETWDS